MGDEINDVKDIRDTIAKLLALADSPNENEAKAALLKARKLMAKHKLRPDEVSERQNGRVIRALVGISCTKMTNTWAAELSAIVASHYCCKAYRERKHGAKKISIGFVGLENDFEVCSSIFKYAYDFVAAKCKQIRKVNKALPAHVVRQMCNSYATGFCNGLESAYDEQDHKNQEYALVLVTPQEVTVAMKGMGKPSVYGDIRTGLHKEIVAQGYSDGKAFDPATKLEGKAGNTGDTLRINTDTTHPNYTYINGRFSGKLFEFTYFYDTKEFKFGTTPFIDGEYVECDALSESEQKELMEAWLTQQFRGE